MPKDNICKIIVRREYNKYTKEWEYIVGFPETTALRGRIMTQNITADFNTFQGHCEADLDYFLRRKIVHAKTDEAKKVAEALTKFYAYDGENTVFVAVDRIKYPMRWC